MPGPQMKPEHKLIQGIERVEAYKKHMPALLDSFMEEKEAYKGGLKYVDFFDMSVGATTYDGMHYSYQVNMEKVQIFLVRLFSFLSLPLAFLPLFRC
jgi:hypothetical protein